MKNYNLLNQEEFELAVEESGLSRSTLRGVRFGLVYGASLSIKPDSAVTLKILSPKEENDAIHQYIMLLKRL